jgi:serine/threonine protein kinase
VSDDLISRVVGGRFRLESLLGAGGMGEVYVATDTATGTRIALKVIRETLAESKEAIARFEREVQATEALHHPNIVRFLAAGQDGALRYLAMELLEGCTLKDRIASRGAIPWRETLPILRGIVNALGAAHQAGLIHRDLKPENVFLAFDSVGAPAQVKLLDFGVAKHTALPEGMTMTGTGIIVGTPGFVAPEVVLLGVTNDPRSDFYALGATWFEMLTASKPFSAATPFALAMRHLNETPPRPTTLVPFAPIPPPVEELVARLLAKSPEQRPPNAAELLAAIDALETASLTPMPMPAERMGLGAVEKTVTDMATPQPLATLSDIGLVVKNTPQTGFMSVDGAQLAQPASPLPAREAPGRTRRAALLGVGAVGVVALLGVLMAGRGTRPRRKRVEDRRPARVGVEPPALGPSITHDAGTAPDAGAQLIDAGSAPQLQPRPRLRDKPIKPVKPYLDVDPPTP